MKTEILLSSNGWEYSQLIEIYSENKPIQIGDSRIEIKTSEGLILICFPEVCEIVDGIEYNKGDRVSIIRGKYAGYKGTMLGWMNDKMDIYIDNIQASDDHRFLPYQIEKIKE